ncbi:Metallopeptidase ImmA [Caloramator mitchellensis]|uniref:Metallopeptidase ImmA n=1 Tax=Caloramator mitchellensis TaxID=908809 RepID=A0A0R3JYI2_CALMK|nr:ImmA/IrrE family metallo-endopeptidase [Caloramator mitchellensis]KRQ86012.1 Metallopeptidase ImmA [Caloramator mitchellensis]
MNYIKTKVDELVKKYKTNNPFELADFLGITAVNWDFPSEIKGIYQYEKRNKFIYLNKQLTYSESLYVCGHEIGHAILHTKINCTFLKQYTLLSTNKLENEANLFSSYLLIPDETLKQYEGYSIEQIAAIFCIPSELLIIR